MAHPQPDIETKARNKFRRRTKVSLIGNFFAATKKDQAGRSGYENEGLHLYKVIFFISIPFKQYSLTLATSTLIIS